MRMIQVITKNKTSIDVFNVNYTLAEEAVGVFGDGIEDIMQYIVRQCIITGVPEVFQILLQY